MNLSVFGKKLSVGGDVSTNKASILRALDEAATAGADILITPEGSLSGYTHEFDQRQTEDALSEIADHARGLRIAMALGTCFYEDQKHCYNQIRFYSAEGEYLGFHSKTLRCGTMDDPPKGEINHYAATPLRTFELNGTSIGGLICNDMWANPQCTPMPDTHLCQQLAGMGVRIVFHAVNGGRNGGEWSDVAWAFHESNLRMRARAASVWVVTVDNSDPVGFSSSAPSGVIDPDGNWVARAEDKGESSFFNTIAL
jgi:predicted amidohydrolase